MHVVMKTEGLVTILTMTTRDWRLEDDDNQDEEDGKK